MNCYDFDQTILKGNTVRRFWWYSAVRFPYLWLLAPLILPICLLRWLHVISKDLFLRLMELFEVLVPNKAKHAKKFWDKNQKHIKQWYLNVRCDDDVIVSASPDYLIKEICSRLNVKCIATETKTNGAAAGKHCYGEEKVKEFEKHFPQTQPLTYFSDSLSDTPMFKFAKEGYLVKGNKITLIYRDGEKV